MVTIHIRTYIAMVYIFVSNVLHYASPYSAVEKITSAHAFIISFRTVTQIISYGEELLTYLPHSLTPAVTYSLTYSPNQSIYQRPYQSNTSSHWYHPRGAIVVGHQLEAIFKGPLQPKRGRFVLHVGVIWFPLISSQNTYYCIKMPKLRNYIPYMLHD